MDEIKVEEVVKADTQIQHTNNPIMNLLEMAVNNNLDVEKLERLMQMKKDYDAQQAKLAFD
ncbi:MAG: hypothetical protein ACYDBX_04545, partial [Patescibacteria group bacterium]